MAATSSHPVARGIRTAALLPLLVLLLGACTGDISLEEEERLGATYAAEINRQVPLIQDPAAVAALNDLGAKLAQRADSTGRQYRFYLVDSPDVNAFAVPGGHIYVNRGLIEQADELAELAGVLGHEIAHVTERHGLEQVEKRERANFLVNLIYMLLEREPGVLERIALEGGGAAVFAKHGRDAEREADEHAVRTLVAAGYHPEGMATFFEELLAAQRRQPGRFETWFSSHPTSEERVQNARAAIRTLGPLDEQRLARDTPEYQRFRARVQAVGALR